MATKAKDRPGPAPPRTRYEDDLYTWVQEQVALLRAGRLAEVDAESSANSSSMAMPRVETAQLLRRGSTTIRSRRLAPIRSMR